MRPSTGSTRSTLLSLSLLLSPSLAHPAILDGPHGGHSGGAGGGGAYGALLEGIDLNAISSIISPFIPGLDLSVLKDIDFKNLNYTRLAPLVSTVSSFLGTAADTGMLVGLASGFIPPLAKSNVVDLTPALNRTGSKRIKVRLGPLTLLGKDEYSKKPAAFSKGSFMSLDPHGQSYINTFPAQSLCTNCTILAGASSLEFEDGSPADPDHGVYIHHILSADITRWGTTTILPCDVPDKDVDTIAKTFKMLAPSAFLGRAEDNGRDTVLFTSRDGNFNSGFHLTDKNTFLLQTDFVNYNNDTKKVFVTFDIEYVDGITGQEASTNLLSVVGCGAGEPKVNMTGVAVTESKKFPILMDGTIIALSMFSLPVCVMMCANEGGRGSFTQWR